MWPHCECEEAPSLSLCVVAVELNSTSRSVAVHLSVCSAPSRLCIPRCMLFHCSSHLPPSPHILREAWQFKRVSQKHMFCCPHSPHHLNIAPTHLSYAAAFRHPNPSVRPHVRATVSPEDPPCSPPLLVSPSLSICSSAFIASYPPPPHKYPYTSKVIFGKRRQRPPVLLNFTSPSLV
jgi:hypothetical protein